MVARPGPAVLVALLALGGSACERSTADPSDRSVCQQLQKMVDALGGGQSVEAVSAYDAMVAAAQRADGHTDVLRLARRMAEITDARVDESELPMSEVPALAQQALSASSEALAGLVGACSEAGVEIRDLDAAAEEP